MVTERPAGHCIEVQHSMQRRGARIAWAELTAMG